MNEGFSLDDSIKLICDGEILVKPVIPLTEAEKNLLVDQFFKQFHKDMRTRLYLSKCLERSEVYDYFQDKNFLQARAFIFMKRCLNRFDKSRYQGSDFGLPEKEMKDFSDIDFKFAHEWKIISEEDGIFKYKDISAPTYRKFINALKRNPEVHKEVKELVQITRLKFFWTVFYREAINQLAGETIKWKKNKGIPTKPELKRSGVDPEAYIKGLRELQDFQVESRSVPDGVEEESSEDADKTYLSLENRLLKSMPFVFRRYFFCSNILGMDNHELALEFTDKKIKQLNHIQTLLKKKVKRLLGKHHEI